MDEIIESPHEDPDVRTAYLWCESCDKRSMICIMVEQNRPKPPLYCPYCGVLSKVGKCDIKDIKDIEEEEIN